MQIFTTIKEVNSYIRKMKIAGKTIGFVPTMGALHAGHLELMERAKSENDLMAVSIFVNPTQFNNPDDLKKYPRTLDDDIEKLKSINCDILFTPDSQEMYPEKEIRHFDFGPLERVMEGAFRPGHFNGVAVVVEKLFRIMEPHYAYFGEKDFQQLVIIRKLVEQESIPVEIVPCPIVREDDGLAMSSRNTRLNSKERAAAPFICEMLLEAKELSSSLSPKEVKDRIEEKFSRNESFDLEYFEISETTELKQVNSWTEAPLIVGCIAAYLGPVRLIDNMILFRNFAPA